MNKSKIFDFARNLYGRISYSYPLIKSGSAILPLRYFFELTYRCNLNCPFCYLGSERYKKELLTSDWFKIINQIPFYAFVTLVGGEPLLRDDFCEILYKTSEKTFGKLNVVTNGVLLNDKIQNAIIDSKILLLSVSLDGWKANHDKNRNKEGIFDIIHSNLESLNKKRKVQNSKLMVDIKTIILKDNLEDVLKLYEYATDNKFEFFSVSFLRNNNLKQNPILHNSFDEVFYKKEYPVELYFDIKKFEEIYLEMQKIKKHSKTKIRFAPKFDDDNADIELEKIKNFFLNSKDKNNIDIYKPCLYPYSNTIINPEGDVYPCLSVKMGNVKENSLKDTINSPLYRCFRKNLKYSKVFSSCQMCCELKVK